MNNKYSIKDNVKAALKEIVGSIVYPEE